MFGGMIRYELRKAMPFYAPIMIIMIGYVLFRGRPLRGDDPMIMAMAIAQGWILSWAIFRDPENTRPFIFSRPFSRRRLFLVRWTSGLLIQAIGLAIIFLILITGLRSWLQIRLGSLYHPRVRWLELEALPSIGLFSILSYEVGMFFKLRAEVSPYRPKSLVRGIVQGLAIGLTALLLLDLFWGFVLSPWRIGLPIEIPPIPGGNPFPLIYIAVVSVLATVASILCYERMEVEG